MVQMCIYCQEKQATTVDHVPPKCLFLKPRPDLVTVPACQDCNNRASLDDEYFRASLASRHETDDSPAAEKLRKILFRSFERSEGWRAGWFEKTRFVEFVNELGRDDFKMQYQMDYDRLARVAERTIRGLHYHSFGELLPKECPILIMQDWALAADERSPGSKTSEFIANVIRQSDEQIVKPGVFSYRRASVEGEPLTAVWFLKFFDCIWIMGIVNVSGDPGRRSNFAIRDA